MNRRSSSRLSLANKDPTIDVGDEVVLLSNNLEGIVRFSGPTEFAGGQWIGIELVEPLGKNDGSVQEIRYFDCPENHGIFVRAAQLRLVLLTDDRNVDPLYAIANKESSVSNSPMKQSPGSGQSSPNGKLPRRTSTSGLSDRLNQLSRPSSRMSTGRKSLVGSPEIQDKAIPKPTVHSKKTTTALELDTVPERDPSPPPVRMTRSRAQAEALKSKGASEPKSALPNPKTVTKKSTRKKVNEKPEHDETSEATVVKSGSTGSVEEIRGRTFGRNSLGLTNTSPTVVDQKASFRRSVSPARTVSLSPVRPSSPKRMNSSKLLEQESMALIEDLDIETPTTDEIVKSPKEKARSLSQLVLKDVETMTKSPVTSHFTSKLPSPIKLVHSNVNENREGFQVQVIVSPKEASSEKDTVSEMSLALGQVESNRTYRQQLKKDESVSELDDGPTLQEVKKLKAELKKQLERNNALISQQTKLHQELNSSRDAEADLRLELSEMKKMLDIPHKEALQESYNLLMSKYEGARNDISNLQIQNEKLKTQINKLLKEYDKVKSDLEEKTDTLEMALIDKCMAEEQLEIQRTKEQELQERIEELSLELDLAQEHHFEPVDVKRKDLLDQDRLVQALIKLREVSIQKETDLIGKLHNRERDLARLKTIEESHNALQENLIEAAKKIEYLKVQLDDAQESSELIHKLTETNLNLDDLLAQKRIETMELENLQRLNNELEIAHVELENQLYQECDLKDEVIQELTNRFGALQIKLTETEQIVSHLRSISGEPISQPDPVTASENERLKLKLKTLEVHCRSLDQKIAVKVKELNTTKFRLEQTLSLPYFTDTAHLVENGLKLHFLEEFIVLLLNVMSERMSSTDSGTLDGSFVLDLCSLLCKVADVRLAVDYASFNADNLEYLTEMLALIEGMIVSRDITKESISKVKHHLSGMETLDTSSFKNKLYHSNTAMARLHSAFFMSRAIEWELESLSDYKDQKGGQIVQIKSILKRICDAVCVLNGSMQGDLVLPCSFWEEINAAMLKLKKIHTKMKSQKNLEYSQLNHANVNGGEEQISDTLLSIFESLKNCEKNLALSITKNDLSPVWIAQVKDMEAKLATLHETETKMQELETRLTAQIQKTAEKSEEIGRLQLTIEKLEKSLSGTDELHIGIQKLEKGLKDMTDLKEKYEKGLEMMHADFEESNQEYELLSKQYQALQHHLKQRSPSKHNPAPVSSENAVLDPDAKLSTIAFLWKENTRLKNLELEAKYQDLFQPSDFVHQRVLNSEVFQSEYDHHRTRKLKQSIRNLQSKWMMECSRPKVVDVTLITGENVKQWKPNHFEPNIQLMIERQKKVELKNQTKELLNNFDFRVVPRNELGDMVPVGYVQFPTTSYKGREMKLDLYSRIQFQKLHELLVF